MEARARLGTPKRYAIQIDRAAREFRNLPVEVQTILRLCDGTRSLRTLRADCGLSPAVFARVLYRLVTLGLVGAAPEERPDRRVVADRAMAWTRHVGRPLELTVPKQAEVGLPFNDTMEIAFIASDTIEVSPPPPGDFSNDEEAFFQRTIDHLLEPEERVISLD